MTKDPGYDRSAVGLDDEHIVYSSMMTGNATLFRQRADGSGSPEQLTSASRGAQFPLSLAPDGKSVVFERSGDPITSNDLMMLHLDRPVSASPTAASLASRDIGRTASLRETQPLVNDPAEQADGVISPDGRWLAYQSDESGIVEIYVRPFPDMKSGARHTVSSDTGAQPRWSSDGRELFFVSVRTNAMMSVRVHAGATWSAEPPQKLFDASVYTVRAPFPWLNYDVAKDGRFLMIKPLGRSAANGEGSASLVVVANWFEELKRLVPAK